LLQGKMRDAGIDTARFLLNTTIGVVGVFDVATRMGLQRNDEDFGQTLGAWGVDSGPFVMLPFFGPSTVRDAGGRAADGLAGYSYRSQMDHVPSRNTATGVDVEDTRAGLLSQERLIRGDKYRFIRNAWLQNREFKVRDGQVEDDFSAGCLPGRMGVMSAPWQSQAVLTSDKPLWPTSSARLAVET